MNDAILLAALVGLFILYTRLRARVAKLERRIAAWDGSSAAEPITEAEVWAEDATPSRRSTSDLAGPVADEPIAEIVGPEAYGTAEIGSAPLAPSARESLASGFERLVGGRLLIWVGGIALALAGLFLVRYAVEVGLIGPAARMIVAALFGLLLLAGGEIARRRFPKDPRIGQALVGAGVLVLYAAAYASHILYGLIGLGTAFAAMALVAGVALILSLRHGTPAAALGLVGGLATPLLVGDPDAVALPLLIYLGLLNVAVFAVAMRTRRRWLAWAAKLGTLLWTASLILRGGEGALAAGLFLLVNAVASALALDEEHEPYPSFAPTFAMLQLGLLVPIADFDSRAWALFFALAAAAFALADRRRGMLAVPPRAMAAALALVGAHALFSQSQPVPEPRAVLTFAAIVTLIFAAGSWLRLGEGAGSRRWPWIFCAAAAGPLVILRIAQPDLFPRPAWGALAAALALAPAALGWRLRGQARRDPPFASGLLAAGATASLLLAIAAFDLAAPRWVPMAWLLVALGLSGAARRLGDGGLARLSVLLAGLAALAVASQTPLLWRALVASLGGAPALVAGLTTLSDAALLFAAPALLLLALWRWAPAHEAGLAKFLASLAAAFALLAVYILFKQIFALRTQADFVARGFAERTLMTQGLFFAGWLLLRRPRLKMLGGIAFALTALAAARFAWFDLLVLNPAFVAQDVGSPPLLNLLAPAYLGSAFWLFEARRRAAEGAATSIYLALFLAALAVGAGLIVRQLFHGAILTGGAMPRAEFYGYSLAGLLLSVSLLLYGWKRRDTPLRVAGLAVLTATVVKVFLVDAAALEGVLRILSFLGLGIALIGMGKLYGTVLGREAAET